MEVSIHAPARGATRPGRLAAGGKKCFNPRPRAGGDKTNSSKTTKKWMFQSTPPRGGRPCLRRIGLHVWLFQSTPPRGGRPKIDIRVAVCIWFQSTPPRGGRQPWAHSFAVGRLFQSTPPRGGRRGTTVIDGGMTIVSIHAPARGATSSVLTRQQPVSCFNPRPRAGGDAVLLCRPTPPGTVSIHAPARGATVRRGACGARMGVSIHAPARGATPVVECPHE